jgi:hypothetical protein
MADSAPGVSCQHWQISLVTLLSNNPELLPKNNTFNLSRTKKTMIVDVVIVNSVMWAEGCERGERGERGKSQSEGQLLPDRGLEWMGIRHHEHEIGPTISWGSLTFLQKVQ